MYILLYKLVSDLERKSTHQRVHSRFRGCDKDDLIVQYCFCTLVHLLDRNDGLLVIQSSTHPGSKHEEETDSVFNWFLIFKSRYDEQ